MRLVLVHGRAQGERTEAEIRAQWLTALQSGCAKAGIAGLPDDADVRVPFYGARLDELTAAPTALEGEPVARGPGGEPDRLEAALVLELAGRAGVTDDEVAAELPETVPRGAESWPWVLATARSLSKRLPWLSKAVLRRFTADVNAYLSRPAVRREINGMVAAEIGPGPTVVVGHSLGSIVTYCTLHEHPDWPVPLFFTLGSPLGIEVIKQALPRPLGNPTSAKVWLNAADERDPVALIPRLDRDQFPAEIENLSDVHNPRDWPHGIAGYLSDGVIARRIVAATAST